MGIMDCPLFWLRRSYHAGKQRVDAALAAHNLTTAQLEVLLQVKQVPQIEQRQLQQLLGVRSATLAGVIDRLLVHGFIEQHTSTCDARVKYITLTPCGIGVCESVADIHTKVSATLFAGFTPAELALLNQWLQRVVSNGENGEFTTDCS
jgi:DNA-binding MarR family transcriptional regulator